MSRDWRRYRDDVEAHAAAALRIVDGVPRDAVFADERTRFAEFPDRLAHAYGQIREDVVWDVLQRDLEPLREAAAALLAEADRADPPRRG